MDDSAMLLAMSVILPWGLSPAVVGNALASATYGFRHSLLPYIKGKFVFIAQRQRTLRMNSWQLPFN